MVRQEQWTYPRGLFENGIYIFLLREPSAPDIVFLANEATTQLGLHLG